MPIQKLQVERILLNGLLIVVTVMMLQTSTSSNILAAEPSTRQPTRLIFDTDMGNDIDDALALALIHALEDRGECRLLAVTLTKDNPHAAVYCNLVNTFYGRGNIPVGKVRSGKTTSPGGFVAKVANATDDGQPRYPRSLAVDDEIPNAIGLLRRVLAGQPDHSVVIVQVGFSTNLAGLLASKPDKHSSLDGRTLVEKKVKLLSIMGGHFADESFREYNIKIDVPSAQKLVHECPGKIIFSGYEIGKTILFPAESIAADFRYVEHHPVSEAYRYYKKFPYDRPTWDLTSVLQVVRPHRHYFGVSPTGKVIVEDDGRTRFIPGAGLHRHLSVSDAQRLRVRETFVHLCSQPPKQNIHPPRR